jgi:hypothetical protein
MEEHKLQVVRNRIRKIFGTMRNYITEHFRIIHEELHDSYRSASTIGAGVAKSV